MAHDHIAKTVAVYNTIAQDYAKKIEEYPPEIERQKFKTLAPPRGHILDVGCASGRDAGYFHNCGYEVVGIDLSDALLRIAKLNHPLVTFEHQDMRSLNFPEKSFDGIWASASLLHLKRDEVLPVLTSFYTLLKHGGIFFVSLREGEGEADVVDPLSYGNKRHYTFFTVSEFIALLTKAGFVSIDTYTWKERDRHPERRDLVWISSFSKKP